MKMISGQSTTSSATSAHEVPIAIVAQCLRYSNLRAAA